jgi:hypothetical protein
LPLGGAYPSPSGRRWPEGPDEGLRIIVVLGDQSGSARLAPVTSSGGQKPLSVGLRPTPSPKGRREAAPAFALLKFCASPRSPTAADAFNDRRLRWRLCRFNRLPISRYVESPIVRPRWMRSKCVRATPPEITGTSAPKPQACQAFSCLGGTPAGVATHDMVSGVSGLVARSSDSLTLSRISDVGRCQAPRSLQLCKSEAVRLNGLLRPSGAPAGQRGR